MKIESILRMELPPDKETLHFFLGLVNFMNCYTTELAELCSALRKLLLKDCHYFPGEIHHSAFHAIKTEFQERVYFLTLIRRVLMQYFYKKNTKSI